MRTAAEWFNEYAQTHQHPLNQKLHYICVPAIFWSVAALLVSIPTPALFPPWLNWAVIILIPVMIFYGSLGIKYFGIMLPVSIVTVFSSMIMAKAGLNVPVIGLSVFIVAWIGQFYGHKVEGKKPSFFTDLLFLLIGPLWVIEKARRKISN
ncbi:MAG: hypothetical protein K0R29_512 [Pseudobdellovibrio sp.]|nr:hypothetical protein [Pseudobdellovibrio sp.]